MRLLIPMLCAIPLLAQVDTGAVSGVVTDRSGSVVPAAHLRITQVDTNAQTDLDTNESGFYSAPALRPGRYEISVAKEGFRPQKSQPFDLRVQDRAEVNFQLDLGATSSEITVSASAPLLESETSSLGQVIEEKTVTDLPLNGRNFIQLATLGAGTLPSTRTAERDNFIANGARAVQNSYLLDGIDNKNRIMGFDKSSAQIVQPIIDAIQEFKVQTATFSAEFGQAAGGVVNVTLKSGTNGFHGGLFEFLRNSDLDATPYFQPSGGKPLFIQNQFGATVGGPIVKDRTFFFGAWQSSREVNAAPQIASVPTPATRQGIFPSRVTDPATHAPFANNTIPQSQWDPVSAKLLDLYPSPNLPGTVRNFFYNPKERVSGDQYSVRVDHRFGAKDSMFFRISQSFGDNQLPTALPDPANQQGAIHLEARSIALSETHTLASNKVNEFRVGFVFSRNFQDVLGPRLFDQFGIKGALDTPNIKGLPQFLITGLTTLGTTPPGSTPIPASGSGNFPSDKSGKIWQILDNVSWVHDRHTIKFGVDLQRVTMFVYATNQARPNFNFNGTYTGNGLGDFLLGEIYTVSTSQQQVDTIQQRVYQGYVQDDWKATSRLTLNVGLRYELPTPFVEEHDRQSNFVLDSGPCHLQLITVAARGTCGISRALTRTDYNNFAPRLGLAYQATSKMVVRSGFGVFYGRDEDLGIQRRLPNNPPFITSATFAGDQANPAFLLRNGFPANALSLASGASDVNSFPFDFSVPYVVQWNLNVQRDLGANFVAQIGYTGSEAHKLASVVNVNQPFPGAGSVNSRRPYQGYGNIQMYGPFLNSKYDALLAKVERRFAHGMTLLASYTYGHSIDGGGNANDSNDPGPQNARDLAAQKGSSNFDIRHRFVLSGLYQLPFRNSLLRNWQLSGIFSEQTGQPFTVTMSTDPSGTNTTARPNRLRDGSLPSDQGVQRGPSHWFDTTAFAAPGCVCFGNSGRNILRAPGFVNVDLGIHRDFIYRERFRLQFRGEAFNLFNHPNFGLPAMAIG
ncbi:MAG: TonB-dependent receptor, partial [Acidobacteriota bacterium]|nr:TonB-dependent receptor [Acidobacteriota bacterium]